MKAIIRSLLMMFAIASLLVIPPSSPGIAAPADDWEDYTYTLTQSTGCLPFLDDAAERACLQRCCRAHCDRQRHQSLRRPQRVRAVPDRRQTGGIGQRHRQRGQFRQRDHRRTLPGQVRQPDRDDRQPGTHRPVSRSAVAARQRRQRGADRGRKHSVLVQRLRPGGRRVRRLHRQHDHRRRGDPGHAARLQFRHPRRTPRRIADELLARDVSGGVQRPRHGYRILDVRGWHQASTSSTTG